MRCLGQGFGSGWAWPGSDPIEKNGIRIGPSRKLGSGSDHLEKKPGSGCDRLNEKPDRDKILEKQPYSGSDVIKCIRNFFLNFNIEVNNWDISTLFDQ